VKGATPRCNAKNAMRKERHEKSNARKETQKLQCKSNAKTSVRGIMWKLQCEKSSIGNNNVKGAVTCEKQ